MLTIADDLLFSETDNPLDNVERVLVHNQWSFDRPNPDELNMALQARMGTYHMHFVWHDDHHALQLFSALEDIRIPPNRWPDALALVAQLNRHLWLGHFDLDQTLQTAVFRYTLLCHDDDHPNLMTSIAEVMDQALAECERAHVLFRPLTDAGAAPLAGAALDLALACAQGRG